jgi:RES domain-containing protein
VTVSLWRIAADTLLWTAEDVGGKGAAQRGARWNHAGEHVIYASTTIALAAWETRAHFGRGARLPWNRYLVRIEVTDNVWAAREVVAHPPPVGWDTIPQGLVSRATGSGWLGAGRSALLAVPSVIVVEKDNVRINPAHADARRLSAAKVRRFVYDPRA